MSSLLALLLVAADAVAAGHGAHLVLGARIGGIAHLALGGATALAAGFFLPLLATTPTSGFVGAAALAALALVHVLKHGKTKYEAQEAVDDWLATH